MAPATEPLCNAPAVCEASRVTTSTFLLSTSAVLENALPPLFSVTRPAAWSTSRPRAWLIASFGMATLAPAGNALACLYFRE